MAIAKKFNPLIICNYEISNYLSQKGFKTHPLQIGGKRKFDFGVVKMTPALHGSGIE
jgi:L-ascorbate metabolism protein UlaG (beta-lactamase superfamily)